MWSERQEQRSQVENVLHCCSTVRHLLTSHHHHRIDIYFKHVNFNRKRSTRSQGSAVPPRVHGRGAQHGKGAHGGTHAR